MTTNKPGTVSQQPLFGCTSCYEEVSYPADHLHVHNGECWSEICWDNIIGEHGSSLAWGELEPFVPALQAEYENLKLDRDQQYQMKVMARVQRGEVTQELKILEAEYAQLHDRFHRLIALGEDFHWENILRVDISDFSSRAEAVVAVLHPGRHRIRWSCHASGVPGVVLFRADMGSRGVAARAVNVALILQAVDPVGAFQRELDNTIVGWRDPV